jgi:hypothetical protein
MESFLCVYVFSQVVFGFFQEKIFEKTLKIKVIKYIARALPIIQGVDMDDSCCANFCVKMMVLLFQVVLFVVTLPLNFIPGIFLSLPNSFPSDWHNCLLLPQCAFTGVAISRVLANGA